MFGYYGHSPEQSRQITPAYDPTTARRPVGPSTDPTLYPVQILPGQVRFPMPVGVSTFGGQVIVYPGVRAMRPGPAPDQRAQAIGYRGFGSTDPSGLGGLIGFGG